MKIVFFLFLILIAFIGQSCIRPVTIQEEPPPKVVIDTVQAKPTTFDPVQLGGDVFYEELGGEEPTATEEVFGYRVQIGAFGEKSNAQALQTSAMDKFDEPVYIILSEPFWCVRMGDFRTIMEAKTAKKEAIANGFTEARVVEDKVIIVD